MGRELAHVDMTRVEWRTVEEVFGDVGFHTEPGEQVAVLSHDAETGAMTLLVRLPPGFRAPAPEVHTVDQEEVLLEGDLWLGDVEFRAPSYHFFPAGTPHGPIGSKGGCLVYVSMPGAVDVGYGG
jgi:hypothetical protein